MTSAVRWRIALRFLKIWQTEIGVALVVAYTIPASLFWIGAFLRIWQGNPFLAVFANRVIMLSLFILTIAGLVMYVLGRKTLSDRLKNKQVISLLLMTLGLVLIIEGVFFGLLTGLGPEGYKFTLNDLPDFSLYSAWYILRIACGSLFLVESFISVKHTRSWLRSFAILALILSISTANIQSEANLSSQNNHAPSLHFGKYFWDSPTTNYLQPYQAGYMDTSGRYFSTNRTRVTVSFPDTNASVIQPDNWLAGGMFMVGYDRELVQIDYGFYAILTLDNDGNLSYIFGVTETYECLPYWPYICPFGIYPWTQELFSQSVAIDGVTFSTPITLTASWNASRPGWVSWEYTVDEITYHACAVNVAELAPTIIPRFWVGSRNLVWTVFIGWIPYWQTYPFQFGVMSFYNIGHGGWNALLSNPSYFENDEWHSVETARSICGRNAMLDTRWIWGGENYEGVNAYCYPSLEPYNMKFYYSGSSVKDHTIFWG